jgi:hypothetical protein
MAMAPGAERLYDVFREKASGAAMVEAFSSVSFEKH